MLPKKKQHWQYSQHQQHKEHKRRKFAIANQSQFLLVLCGFDAAVTGVDDDDDDNVDVKYFLGNYLLVNRLKLSEELAKTQMMESIQQVGFEILEVIF